MSHKNKALKRIQSIKVDDNRSFAYYPNIHPYKYGKEKIPAFSTNKMSGHKNDIRLGDVVWQILNRLTHSKHS